MSLNTMGYAAPADEAAMSKEYQVKAVFLFNFAMFVEWPASAFAEVSSPIRIGILGADSFAKTVERYIEGGTVRDRKLVAVVCHRIEDAKDCQILFVSRTAQARIAEILAACGSAPVLLVGESEGFAARGGVINFFIKDNKVKFEIYPDAAQRRGIRISSELLKLARIVNSENEKEHP